LRCAASAAGRKSGSTALLSLAFMCSMLARRTSLSRAANLGEIARNVSCAAARSVL